MKKFKFSYKALVSVALVELGIDYIYFIITFIIKKLNKQ